MSLLDFEKPIAELEAKLNDMKHLAKDSDKDVQAAIKALEKKILELHGDRTVADDKAMVGGLGTIDGKTFMLIGQQKGRNTKQRQMRNFGMANPEGYRKALRLMKI